MALKGLLYDTVTNGLKLAAGALATVPTDEDFDVGVGGQSIFTTANAFTVDTKIEVQINGIHYFEGAGRDWQRTVATSRITFNFTVPQYAHVQIRLWI